MKTIYDLDLNEGMFSDEGEGHIWILRVASGWIYCMAKNVVFVPFVNQKASDDNTEIASILQEAIDLIKTDSAVKIMGAILKINDCRERLRAMQRK
jgi:hypothetical protein